MTTKPRQRYHNPDEAFAARTEWRGECLVWTGTITTRGYGRLHYQYRKITAHRYAWERERGPIPEGMYLDHMCHNRACVNLEHLRLATVSQNGANRDGAMSKSKTGIRGVFPHGNGYRAEVRLNGVPHYRHFYDIDEAARWVDAKRRELFGEYAGRGVRVTEDGTP